MECGRHLEILSTHYTYLTDYRLYFFIYLQWPLTLVLASGYIVKIDFDQTQQNSFKIQWWHASRSSQFSFPIFTFHLSQQRGKYHETRKWEENA